MGKFLRPTNAERGRRLPNPTRPARKSGGNRARPWRRQAPGLRIFDKAAVTSLASVAWVGWLRSRFEPVASWLTARPTNVGSEAGVCISIRGLGTTAKSGAIWDSVTDLAIGLVGETTFFCFAVAGSGWQTPNPLAARCDPPPVAVIL